MTTRAPDYVDPGRPGVWPDGELPEMRVLYDRLMAEQDEDAR